MPTKVPLTIALAVLLAAVTFAAARPAASPAPAPPPAPTRWTEQAAQDWYAKQPWLVGSNYIPATAINELEMWQADSFDPKRIDLELGWAESIGFNTMRVFLHDLLWQQDAEGFRKRIDAFLTSPRNTTSSRCLSCSIPCWDPDPKLGKQRAPTPGVHNSGWVQSPGRQSSGRQVAVSTPRGLCEGRGRRLSPTTSASSAGISGTSPTTPTPAATEVSPRTRRNSSRRYCRKHLPGPAKPTPRSL